jgi:hypothetical protein
VGEDGDPVNQPTPITVRATGPELRVRKDYLGNIVRISELVRVYFVLKNTGQWADRFTRMACMRTRTGSEMTG